MDSYTLHLNVFQVLTTLVCIQKLIEKSVNNKLLTLCSR